MPEKYKIHFMVTIYLFFLMLPAHAFSAPAKAEESWLDWFNGGMFSFNKGVDWAFNGIGSVLPSAPSGFSQGAHNFAVTWISEPLNAGAYLIAGKFGDAGDAMNRMGTNITRGWLGFVDRAAEESKPTKPVDYGLALCAQGVPAGPFIVVPFTGIRTVRDFGADWVAAHVVLYSVLFGVLRLPIDMQTIASVEAVEEVITLSIAGQIGEVPPDAKVDQLASAQEHYLAGRERLCSELARR